ncbi:SAM-dependent methyltransferase [Paenisporosarcina sp. FSL H8-0542]|uniref:SAM-dependent methyltransferase n=1 Tax=Paenisporosarcina sp. FSL H8-0542 TaxID=2921401 RepID=UPI00315A3675
MSEKEMDRMLRIKTAGTLEVLNQSVHYNRYEATPYIALDELFKHYEITKDNRIVDVGCGKGRLSFYIHNHFQVPTIGIEMSGKLYQDALENLQSYDKTGKKSKGLITFERCLAEDYKIDSRDDVFYFFNPFSEQIFMKFVEHILDSVDEHKRSIDLILYYPTSAYLLFLETRTTFEFLREIKVPELYEQNENERFMIFHLPLMKLKIEREEPNTN